MISTWNKTRPTNAAFARLSISIPSTYERAARLFSQFNFPFFIILSCEFFCTFSFKSFRRNGFEYSLSARHCLMLRKPNARTRKPRLELFLTPRRNRKLQQPRQHFRQLRSQFRHRCPRRLWHKATWCRSPASWFPTGEQWCPRRFYPIVWARRWEVSRRVAGAFYISGSKSICSLINSARFSTDKM